MNFLNQSSTQLVDLFRSMTPAARITAGLLLVVVVVSLAYLFRLQSSGGDEYLFGGREFSQAEMGAMEGAFAKAGLAKWEIVGNRIRAPRGQKDKYLAALADAKAMPPDYLDSMDEAVNSTNPFSSRNEFDAKRQVAKQKELSLIISRMKGIRAATVQFDEIEKGFPRRKERTALVAVQPQGNEPLDDDRVRSIRTLVVGAIAGLDSANVAVSDLGASITHPGVGANILDGAENPYNKHKLVFEKAIQEKIHNLLSMYPGVVVGVNVELNTELEHRTQTHKVDAKPVALSTTDISEESTSTAPGPGGRPGAVPNGVGSNAPAQVASVPGPQSQTTKTRNDQKNAAGHEQTTIQKFGFTPKRVTASIALPTSYFAKVWNQQNPPTPGTPPKDPDPAELRKIEQDTRTTIENAVVSLLPPLPPGVDRYPLVTVSTYTDLPRPPEVPPTLTDNATSWLTSNWQTLALVGLGLFSLVFLRGMLKPGPAAPPSLAGADAPPAPQLAATGSDEDADEEEAHPARKRRFRTSGPNLRDELTEMVKEDPDAAANVLKAWIGDAA
jgi:flagellar M-ring protein FliF